MGAPMYGENGLYRAVCLNAGRSAMLVATRHLGAKRLWCPRYYCPSVKDYLARHAIEIVYYDLGDDLLPLYDFEPEDSDVVLLVNYFGLQGSVLKERIGDFSEVLIDNCMAFFEPPVMKRGVLNVYSCRKFFGVADGAYVVGCDLPDVSSLEFDESSGRSLHLLKSIEHGTNAAYDLSILNESSLDCEVKRMSPLTSALMASCDYERSYTARRRNYAALDVLLGSSQMLSVRINEGASPNYYPLLLPFDIRRHLVQRGVYVPTLWREFIESDASKETRESYLSRRLCCLPVDQRYGEKDMELLASIVRQVTEEAI